MQSWASVCCFRRSFQHSNSTPQFSPWLCVVEYWKIAVAAVSFLQVCLLFQWLSSGAQNRPLSLPLFISLCFSFSHSAQTRYKNYQFAYEIGWKAKLVELHWVKAVTHTQHVLTDMFVLFAGCSVYKVPLHRKTQRNIWISDSFRALSRDEYYCCSLAWVIRSKQSHGFVAKASEHGTFRAMLRQAGWLFYRVNPPSCPQSLSSNHKRTYRALF